MREQDYEQLTLFRGGFPCQPFSTAGKRRGKEDDRYLWPEMLRVIQEIRPRWVVGENVAGIVNMALDEVLADLESIGYTCEAIMVPACGVDAPHRRDRTAIVAYTKCIGQRQDGHQPTHDQERYNPAHREVRGPELCQIGCGGSYVSDTDSIGLEEQGMQGLPKESGVPASNRGRRETQSGLGGMDDGISNWLDAGLSAPGYWLPDPAPGIPRVTSVLKNRVDRLKCLGNAVVPQQFYPIFQAIVDLEEEK